MLLFKKLILVYFWKMRIRDRRQYFFEINEFLLRIRASAIILGQKLLAAQKKANHATINSAQAHPCGGFLSRALYICHVKHVTRESRGRHVTTLAAFGEEGELNRSLELENAETANQRRRDGTTAGAWPVA